MWLVLAASCASGGGAAPRLRVDGGKLAARLALLDRLREEPDASEEAKGPPPPGSDGGLGGAAGGPGESAEESDDLASSGDPQPEGDGDGSSL